MADEMPATATAPPPPLIDSPEPTLLGLPNELLVMVGEHMETGPDLCNLRSACLQICTGLQPLFSQRVSVPITLDSAGVAQLRLATTRVGRLDPAARWLESIQLVERLTDRRINVFVRNDDVLGKEELVARQAAGQIQRCDQLSSDFDNQCCDVSGIAKYSYEGYYWHDICFANHIPDFLTPPIYQGDTTAISNMLGQCEKVRAVGASARCTQVDLLFNHHDAFVPEGDAMIEAMETMDGCPVWEAEIPNDDDPWTRAYIINTYTRTIDVDTASEEWTFASVHMAYLDLLRIKLTFDPQIPMSRTLQRLTLYAIGFEEDADDEKSKLEELKSFLRKCVSLRRLRLHLGFNLQQYPQSGLAAHHLFEMLSRTDVLPRLTHLRVEGGAFDHLAFDALSMRINDPASLLEYLYISPAKYYDEFQLMDGYVSRFLRHVQHSTTVTKLYLDLGRYGFEQICHGRGSVYLEERIFLRAKIFQTCHIYSTTCVDPTLSRSDYRTGDAWPGSSNAAIEEDQKIVDCLLEWGRVFDAVRFD